MSGYKIERSIDGADYSERVSSRSAGTTHWVDTSEPAEGESRTYRVTSINSAGTGTEMATITLPLAEHTTHPPAAASDLGPPTMVMATSDETGKLTITWEGGENADSFVLVALDIAAYDAGEARYYETSSVSDGAARTGDITALTSGKEYVVMVVAIQGTGASAMYTFGVATAAVEVQ